MGKTAAERRIENGVRRIARLELNQARILLEFAHITAGKRAVALSAASVSEHQQLFRMAISEIGLKERFFDPNQFSQNLSYIEALRDAEVVVILEDEDYRGASFSKQQIQWLLDKRPDIRPVLIRIGDIEDHPDIEFITQGFEILDLPDPKDWRVVPLFLREAIGRAFV